MRLYGIYEIDHPIGLAEWEKSQKGHVVETGDPVAIRMMLAELSENDGLSTLFERRHPQLHHIHVDAVVRHDVFTVEPVLRPPYWRWRSVDGRMLTDILDDDDPCRSK